MKVGRELKRPLGNAIGGFKTGSEKIYARLGGEDSAEINYRGLLPANIDALAKAAAQIA